MLKPARYYFVPRIALVTVCLFLPCNAVQFNRIQPPNRAAAKPHHRLSPQLIPVPGEFVDQYPRTGDRPEPTPARFVSQICTLIHAASEHALTWRFNQTSAVKADGSGHRLGS